MSDLQSQWAESAWRKLVDSRRKRDRTHSLLGGSLALCGVALLVIGVVQRDRIARGSPLSIREIVVTDNRTVERDEVLDLLGVRPGDPWWGYSPRAVRERARKHPRIGSLRSHYAWFHELHVEVVERLPALTVLDGPGGELTVDGWYLPTRIVGEIVDLPILRPLEGSFPAHGDRVGPRPAAVAHLVGELRRTHPGLWRDLSEIELTEDEARAYLRSGRSVILFTPGLHEELWGQVPAVLEDLRLLGRRDVVIDLRFTGRIVVHLSEEGDVDSPVDPNPLEKV